MTESNSVGYIPFNKPSIGDEEIAEVVDTLKSGWLTTGPKTARFEDAFRQYSQAGHALAVNSGTAAMHLALAALDIGPGDEVITTPLTFCATVNTILEVGATPVLADVLQDGNIDPSSIESRIRSATRAIMPVHLCGLPCHMADIWSIAEKHGLRVIEDAAHAAGSLYKGRPIGAARTGPGTGSDATAFSFYATKNMTTGEGGMVTADEEDLIERMRRLCLHGISKDAWARYAEKGKWYYEVAEVGFKYNLSDIQSALGIHQLRKLDAAIERREALARRYQDALGDLEEVELPPTRPDSRHSWHLYAIRLNLPLLAIGRDEFIARLGKRRIGTSVHFIPVPIHPFFAPYRDRPENQCPAALELWQRLVSLPLYPSMTEEEVDYVAAAIKEIIYGARKSLSVPVLA